MENESQTKYICAAFSMELLTCIAIDISNDTVDVSTKCADVLYAEYKKQQQRKLHSGVR